MFNKINLLLIFFVTLQSLSQVKSGIVIYKVKFTFVRPKLTLAESQREIFSTMLKGDKLVENLRPVLTFNNNISLFSPPDTPNLEYTMASISAGCYTKIYVNLLNRKVSYYTESAGAVNDVNEFLVENEVPKNIWTMLSETKLIDGYTCIKATSTQKIDGETQNLTAWFCPKLPYPFGPFGVFGLPGLILELQTNKQLFGVDRIILSDKDLVINLPTKGKKVNNEELEKIIKDRMDKL